MQFSLLSILQRALLFSLILSVWMAGCTGPVENASPGGGSSASRADESVAKAASRLPEEVTLESSPDALTMTFDLTTTGTTDHIDFYAIFPADAPLVPEIVDFSITTGGLQAQDGSAIAPIDRRACEKVAGLSDVVRKEIKGRLSVSEEGIVRFWRLVHVDFDSASLRAGTSGPFRLLGLTARFPCEKGGTQDVGSTDGDRGFPAVLRSLVVNPEALSLYADRGRKAGAAPKGPDRWSPLHAASGRWLRVPVSTSGLYRIGPEYLERAGMDAAQVDMAGLRVFSRGREVATHLVQDSPREKEIVFYGLGSDSAFSTERAYWLHVPSESPSSPSLRMRSRANPAAYPDGVEATVDTVQERSVEEDWQLLVSSDQFLNTKEKNWVWREIDPVYVTSVRFDLPDLRPESGDAVSFDMTFYETPLERLMDPEKSDEGFFTIYFRDESVYRARLTQAPPIKLSLNDSLTTSVRPFVGGQRGKVHLDVAFDHLKREGNELTLRFETPFAIAPDATCSNIFFDGMVVRYRRWLYARGGQIQIRTTGEHPWHRTTGFGETRPLLFDLTDPETPSMIEVEALPQEVFAFHEQRASRDLLATLLTAIPPAPDPIPAIETDIASPENEADYLLVYHPMFEEEIRPLLDHQGRRGLKTRAVSVEAIYQEYGAGESSPQAIKDFLTDAVRGWKTPPTYVCLFGDSSSDYRGELRTGVPNLVPAYTATGRNGDSWASELWYACLVGTDCLPDAMIGRLSVQNLEDAREVVRKTVEYNAQAPLGPWRARIGYCSDDGEGFANTMDRVRTESQSPAFLPERIYLEEFSYEDNFYVAGKKLVKELNLKVSTEATLALHEAYRRGLGMMIFFGHGSPNIWTDERIWFGGDSANSDNLNLRNGDRLPFLATFTCNHGAIDYALAKWNICISEDMMRVTQGGAIGLFVPSGPGHTPAHEGVAKALFRGIMKNGFRRLGEITAWTTIDYLLHKGDEEMMRMFVLLGDPSLDLVLPEIAATGRVEPDRIDLDALAGGRARVRFEEAAPQGLRTGRFVAALFDPDGNEALNSGPLSFSKGKTVWAFDMPESPKPGDWTVRAYLGDSEGRRDAVAFSLLPVGRPRVEIASFEFNKKPEKADEDGELEIRIANGSEFESSAVPVILTRSGPTGGEKTLGEWMAVLAPGEEKRLLQPFKSLAGLQGFRVRLGKPGTALGDTGGSVGEKNLDLCVSLSEGGAYLATLPSLARIDWKTAVPAANLSVDVRFFYSGLTTQTALTAVLSTPDGATSRAITRSLQPSDSLVKETPVVFSIVLPAGARPSDLRLRASLKDVDAPPVDLSIPLGAPNLCDIAIMPESVRFTPEQPAEGETVFVRAEVENLGREATPNFDLRLSSVEENGREKELQSRPHCVGFRQDPLGPGRKREVNVRFDYDAGLEYAGEKTIRLKADPSNRVRESDESNNQVDVPLTILSRAETTFTLQVALRDIDDTHKEADVAVWLKNLGEAPAKGRRVGFMNKVPKNGRISDKKDLVEEIVLPPLLGGEEKTFSHKWIVDFSDRDTSPTALVYRPSKALRTEKDGEAPPQAEEW